MEINPSDIRTMVHIITKRTGNPVYDEDLEQEIALHAVEAFRRIDRVTHPRALLMKIVYDTVREHWRHRRSSEDLDSIDERFISQMPTFEYDLDVQRRIELLHRALDVLPASKRMVLELFYTHDQSISEIANVRGKSVSAIKMELLRSRQALARIVRSLANKTSR
jgi:RNA polymerase sigma factor (sigma-70 family)